MHLPNKEISINAPVSFPLANVSVVKQLVSVDIVTAVVQYYCLASGLSSFNTDNIISQRVLSRTTFSCADIGPPLAVKQIFLTY